MTHPLTLAIDAGSLPRRWITFKDVAYYHAKELIEWSMGENEYEIKGGRQADTGLRSIITIPSIVKVTGLMEGKIDGKKYNRTPHITSIGVIRRDHSFCAYCGNKFYEKYMTVDHILPKSRGGENTWTNCIASCYKCNLRKDNKTPEEANMELLFIPYAPDKAEHLILMNKRIYSDQMDFLKGHIKNEESRILQLE